MQRGDNRTPEGEYVLGGRNAGSRFYKSIHISYPNEADRISARERGVNPGGSIMIHGVPPDLTDLGADHRLWDWTNGCIAVTNGEMDEIWNLVDSGTPIEIRSEEHTSELQSLMRISYAVFCLKKKNKLIINRT